MVGGWTSALESAPLPVLGEAHPLCSGALSCAAVSLCRGWMPFMHIADLLPSHQVQAASNQTNYKS